MPTRRWPGHDAAVVCAMNQRVRGALALGAGGARGYAHIGAIEVLEERDIEIVNVAGSSMGALAGGLYAAGELGAYTDWVRTLSQLDVLRLLDVSLTGPGMIRAERVFARMRDLLAGVKIEDLAIPFTAVATDLLARKPIWFQRGPVAPRLTTARPRVRRPRRDRSRSGQSDSAAVRPTCSTVISSARCSATWVAHRARGTTARRCRRKRRNRRHGRRVSAGST